MELPLINKPIIYIWPEYCPSCNEMLGVLQIKVELIALVNHISVFDAISHIIKKPCCKRLIIAGIQKVLHNMNKNIFKTKHCEHILVKSSIITYSNDFTEYVDYERNRQNTISLLQNYNPNILDTLLND